MVLNQPLLLLMVSYAFARSLTADVGIYGATPAGLVAAIEAARHNRSVVVLEPTAWIGGMLTGGLSHTDIGFPNVTGGLAMELFRRIGRKYSRSSGDIACWDFEPHVAGMVLQDMLADPSLGDGRVQVLVDQELRAVDTKRAPQAAGS